MSTTLICYDPALPYDGARPDAAALAALRERAALVCAAELAAALDTHAPECVVMLHGPYFPKNAWPALIRHLRRGGGLVHVGGAPFHRPAYQDDGAWIAETRQTAYHQQLGIHETLPIDPRPIERLAHNPDLPLLAGQEALFEIGPTWGMTVGLSSAGAWPAEPGGSGPLDSAIRPILLGMAGDGRAVAAPVALIEHMRGAWAGGRWLFVNQALGGGFWANGGAAAICEWAAFCGRGAIELWLKPGAASYQPGEQACLTVQAQHAGPRRASEPWRIALDISRDGETVWMHALDLVASDEIAIARIPVPLALDPGLYHVTCRAETAGETRVLHQGFWRHDAALLQAGEPLRCDRDYFWKNGRPLPVVGMTYMDPDVGRHFLLLPNVANWDRDMARMRAGGINFIRTGIWTNWRSLMPLDGHMAEAALCAIDAFLLTARRHDLEVTFTFFAFTPAAWDGQHPYLDPRSIAAQKRFVAQIVARHAATTNVQWDLINEPSLFDPARIFAGPRATQQAHERAAFAAWLRERHGDLRALQARWNMTPDELPAFESAAPPEPHEISFSPHLMGSASRPSARWLDFTLFTMAMHNRWIAALAATIKALAPDQLVTVGQDEALTQQRPAPPFYAAAVDYTSVHSWWMMDHLVWDGVFAKTPGKPNLVQETGIMYVEQADRTARRSEEELRNILERKYAYAFATGAAGAVHWIWNTNPYLNSINESNIGALRADGTEKPEARVSADFGSFIGATRDLFVGRELEDVAVIFPFSNDFGHRKLAFDATTRLARTLAYVVRAPFRALSEYHLDVLADQPPKLLIVPGAHSFSDEAFAALVAHLRECGGVLLWTGPLSLDTYWQPTARARDLVGATRLRNVLREELLEHAGQRWPVSFGGQRIAELSVERPEEANGDATSLVDVAVGRGRLLWCPLPLELNERIEPLAALYRHALAAAGLGADVVWHAGDLPGVYGRALRFRDGTLWTFVSECAHDIDVCVSDARTGAAYSFLLPRERAVLFATDRAGQVSGHYGPSDVRAT